MWELDFYFVGIPWFHHLFSLWNVNEIAWNLNKANHFRMKHYSLLWSRFTFCIVESFGENSFGEQGRCLPSAGGCPQGQRHTHTRWFALCSRAAPRWGSREGFEESPCPCYLNSGQSSGDWPRIISWRSSPGLPLCGHVCLGSLVPGHIQQADPRLLSRLRAKFSGS